MIRRPVPRQWQSLILMYLPKTLENTCRPSLDGCECAQVGLPSHICWCEKKKIVVWFGWRFSGREDVYATSVKQVGENRFLLCFSSSFLCIFAVLIILTHLSCLDVAQFVDMEGNPSINPGDVEKVVFEVQPDTVGLSEAIIAYCYLQETRSDNYNTRHLIFFVFVSVFWGCRDWFLRPSTWASVAPHR